MGTRRTLALEGLDVSNIDFDILQKTNPLGFMLHYTSGACGIKTFEALRAAIAKGFDFVSYQEAQETVMKHGFASKRAFQDWKNNPNNIPGSPDATYQNSGWISWGVFLGTGNVHKKDWLSYEEAQDVVRKAGISTQPDFMDWKERPDNFPSQPNRDYKDEGWVSWGEFLGTGRRNNAAKFLPYVEARKAVIAAGITSTKQFKSWQLPTNIPAAPHLYLQGQRMDFVG